MMKKYHYLLLALCLVLPCVSGCSSDDESSEDAGRPTIDNIQSTESGSKRFVLHAVDKGNGLKLDETIAAEITINAAKEISGDGYQFSDPIEMDNLSTLPDHADVKQWNTRAHATDGTSYWVRYELPSQVAMFKLRIAYVHGINVGVEYIAAGSVAVKNENANVPTADQPYLSNYEMPRRTAENTYVEHTTTFDNATLLNYALEWNDRMKHAQWVAFSFDATTSTKNTNRNEDAWAVDPLLPADMQVDNEWHKNDGFDRGHLCASDDRVFSSDANKQTFYFSNMSPQFNSFNGGYWVTFEQLLLSWVRNDKAYLGTYDKIYVAKGGTLDKLLLNYTGNKAGQDGVMPTTDAKGFTPKGLPVPQYYYLAVLAHRADASASEASAYQAIGFWVEHRDDYGYTFEHPLKREDAKAYAVSIDKLEQETGLDFFCNLPDAIEDAVESACNVADWTW